MIFFRGFFKNTTNRQCREREQFRKWKNPIGIQLKIKKCSSQHVINLSLAHILYLVLHKSIMYQI